MMMLSDMDRLHLLLLLAHQRLHAEVPLFDLDPELRFNTEKMIVVHIRQHLMEPICQPQHVLNIVSYKILF